LFFVFTAGVVPSFFVGMGALIYFSQATTFVFN
jgi:hypothetical protein